MAQIITLKVNGEERKVEIEGHEPLIDILRENFELTGTKRGCDDFHCGACTVVVNGDAVKACWLKAAKADGAEIITIEAMAKGTDLHPIQEALIDSGAVQCGFCIPGIVMGLYALFTRKPDATEEELIETLKEHLCRCTGYETILSGALVAQKMMKAASR